MKKHHFLKQAGALALALTTAATPCYAAVDASAIDPVPGINGYFVDNYKSNTMDNQSPESNAVISVLSPMLSLWQPGDSWNNGVKLGEAGQQVLDQNIQICIDLTNNRTPEQELAAYLTDRRNQNYSALDGLGPYKESFIQLAGAATSLPAEIPADATTVKYSDKGGASGSWADSSSSLGSMVQLVDTIRGPHASGNPAKVYFQYMRPFRWSSQVRILPSLLPCVAGDPMTDGGFPSGHTNAGYLASLSFAYAVPERFQECLTAASEIGNYRIIAGMHSPMDVMGGRTMATALAAASLNDPENAELKAAARKEASEILLTSQTTAEDDYADYAANRQRYEERLTYGLPQTGELGKPMVVPKGAEVLLETRFPYLDSTQRRWVLYSTGLPSGYQFLDDAEGWGRLNLFAAANGYGAFDRDVSVTMDASAGGFSAYDVWRNDISGEGSLSKNGSGTLVLSGTNSYTGGVHVNDGTLTAASSAAFGYSSVENQASITETVDGTVEIKGDFYQGARASLALDVNSAADLFRVNGTVKAGGVLTVDFSDYSNPETGMVVLEAGQWDGAFSSIQAIGLDQGKTLVTTENAVIVADANS